MLSATQQAQTASSRWLQSTSSIRKAKDLGSGQKKESTYAYYLKHANVQQMQRLTLNSVLFKSSMALDANSLVLKVTKP